MKKTEIKPYKFKSFYLTEKTQKELEFLHDVYGENQSAVIRRLITEAYSILRYAKQYKPKSE